MFYPQWLLTRWWWAATLEKVRIRVFGPRMIRPTYDLVSGLPLYLGNSMRVWGNNLHGYPMDREFEEWQADILKHSDALLAFYEDEDETPEALENAKEALHWVADNLQHLWD